MVKMRHKGLLVLGLNRKEMEMLTQHGAPLDIPLDDLSDKLKGQRVMIIPGEDNDKLAKIMNAVADAYQNGATSPIQIAQSIPRDLRLKRPH